MYYIIKKQFIKTPKIILASTVQGKEIEFPRILILRFCHFKCLLLKHQSENTEMATTLQPCRKKTVLWCKKSHRFTSPLRNLVSSMQLPRDALMESQPKATMSICLSVITLFLTRSWYAFHFRPLYIHHTSHGFYVLIDIFSTSRTSSTGISFYFCYVKFSQFSLINL